MARNTKKTDIEKPVSTEEKMTEQPETSESEGLKETDTLPSETEIDTKSRTKGAKKEEKVWKKKKIIGLMGIEHVEGPPGSTHG